MRLLVLIFALFAAMYAYCAPADFSSAEEDARVDCELLMQGQPKQIILNFIMGRIARIDENSVLIEKRFAGALPKALAVFGIESPPPGISMEFDRDKDGTSILRLLTARKPIQSFRLDNDPTLIWKQTTREEIMDGRITMQFHKISAVKTDGYVYGTATPWSKDGNRRFVIFAPISESRLSVLLGIDVPCIQIDNYLDPKIQPVFLFHQNAFFCRIAIFKGIFKVNTSKKPGLIL